MSRVYVGRLSRDAREEDLQRLCSKFGEIKHTVVKNGFGFVEFADSRDADDAIKELHETTFMGETIIVELSKERRPRDRTFNNGPTRQRYRLIVENLSASASWQDLKDFFRRAGEVTFADAHKIKEGEGIVEFAHYDDLKRAIRKFDDMELKGKRLYLREDRGGGGGNVRRDRSRSPPRHNNRSRSRSPRGRRD